MGKEKNNGGLLHVRPAMQLATDGIGNRAGVNKNAKGKNTAGLLNVPLHDANNTVIFCETATERDRILPTYIQHVTGIVGLQVGPRQGGIVANPNKQPQTNTEAPTDTDFIGKQSRHSARQVVAFKYHHRQQNVGTYPSAGAAARALGLPSGQSIHNYIAGKCRKGHGVADAAGNEYHFYYLNPDVYQQVEDDLPINYQKPKKTVRHNGLPVRVVKNDNKNDVIGDYESIYAAATALGITQTQQIYNYLKGKGFAARKHIGILSPIKGYAVHFEYILT